MEAPAHIEATLSTEMRRNLFLLTCCQAVGQAGNVIMFSATALSVISFFPDRELATLPTTLQQVGVMLALFPASALMMRMGRRFGFCIGSVFGMAGAGLGGLGLYTSSFLLMCLGGLLIGCSVASLQMYRFAAVELVPLRYHSRAIAWVTAGGVVAGVLGPVITRVSFDAMAPIYLATYLVMIGLHFIVFCLMSFIRFPPVPYATSHIEGPQRALWEIAIQPRFAAAVMAAMAGFGTMMFVMSASPLAMVGCGLPETEVPMVIFLHVMGMFVPSFFTGNLINRFGVENVMAAGAAILLVSVAAALDGITLWNFRIALALNGVGWNFLFIGATLLVTSCYRPSERGKAQALNDFLIFSTSAAASFLAGFLQERLGWINLNWGSIGLIMVAFGAVLWVRLQRQPAIA